MSGLSDAEAPIVMVVEDEVLIRDIVEIALGEAGFHVLAVEPEEALATLDEYSATLSALVTDINLGAGISGWDIATRARELHPRMSVVYMSGHGAADWPSRGVPDSLMLQKPFASAQMVTAVSGLLNKIDV